MALLSRLQLVAIQLHHGQGDLLGFGRSVRWADNTGPQHVQEQASQILQDLEHEHQWIIPEWPDSLCRARLLQERGLLKHPQECFKVGVSIPNHEELRQSTTP